MSDDAALLLSHPLRHRLLFEYHAPSSPSQVARRLEQRVNVVSYHTDVLRRHGWIELVRTQARRGATEHFYRAIRAPVVEDQDWEALSLGLRRSIVLGTLGIVRDHARAAALEGGFDDARAHLSWAYLDLDDRGVAEAAAILREASERLQALAARSRARNATGRERREFVIQLFRVPPAG